MDLEKDDSVSFCIFLVGDERQKSYKTSIWILKP
jgi:hypothetical protein